MPSFVVVKTMAKRVDKNVASSWASMKQIFLTCLDDSITIFAFFVERLLLQLLFSLIKAVYT